MSTIMEYVASIEARVHHLETQLHINSGKDSKPEGKTIPQKEYDALRFLALKMAPVLSGPLLGGAMVSMDQETTGQVRAALYALGFEVPGVHTSWNHPGDIVPEPGSVELVPTVELHALRRLARMFWFARDWVGLAGHTVTFDRSAIRDIQDILSVLARFNAPKPE